jgi:hypothetical protein
LVPERALSQCRDLSFFRLFDQAKDVAEIGIQISSGPPQFQQEPKFEGFSSPQEAHVIFGPSPGSSESLACSINSLARGASASFTTQSAGSKICSIPSTPERFSFFTNVWMPPFSNTAWKKAILPGTLVLINSTISLHDSLLCGKYTLHLMIMLRFPLIFLLTCSVAFAETGGKIVSAARKQIGVTVNYDPAYVSLDYPGGDVPPERGVCTDVIIRALRDGLNKDLQKLVHEDMRGNFSKYPKIWGLKRPDKNIDHRRVPNLMA